MKHLYPIFIIGLLILSCSEIEPFDGLSEETPAEFSSCFKISATAVAVNEPVQLESCATGAVTHHYETGNGQISDEPNPVVSYDEPGTYTITLTVTSESGESTSFSKEVSVEAGSSFYRFPELPEGISVVPIAAGKHPISGLPYVIEIHIDYSGASPRKYMFRSLDNNLDAQLNFLAEQPYGGNSASVNFLPNGNLNFHFPRTLESLFGSQEITFSMDWAYLTGGNPADKHSFGSLEHTSGFLYYGTAEDGGVYKMAVETRNNAGDAFRIDLFSPTNSDGLIGNMLASAEGFIGFGGVFSKNTAPPYISQYRPVLLFFDADLRLISQVVYEDSRVSSRVAKPDDINGSYRFARLSNGNIAMYALGELTVTDATGTILNTHYFEGTNNNQALLNLGDGFIISSRGYLRKFDSDGREVKSLPYGGEYMPAFIPFQNQLLFVAGKTSEGKVSLFYGAVDESLDLIDLSP